MCSKSRGIYAAHFRLADDEALGDLEAAVLWRDGDVGCRIDLVRREAGPAQDEGERHRKAARMGRAEQLLRVRPRTVLEA